MPRFRLPICLFPLLCLCAALSAQGRAPAVFLPFDEARPVLENLRSLLPAELKSEAASSLPTLWPDWVKRSDAQTRARLERGDEDSLVNLLLFGTTFTKQPRMTARQIEQIIAGAGDPAVAGSRLDAITDGRLNDFMNGVGSPQGNERLVYARRVLAAKGYTVDTAEGRTRAKSYLLGELGRVLKEIDANERIIDQSRQTGIPGAEFAERSRLYRARGLSSDTSLLPNFAVEEALKLMRMNGLIKVNVRRVAVIGPGLDFTDKQEGYDFYPLQTLQPFAVMDSLLRLGLSEPRALQVTTLDVSPRINSYLTNLRAKSLRGEASVLQLPLDSDEHWSGEFLRYWTSFGDQIGERVQPVTVPPNTGNPKLRAVTVRPGVGARVEPVDLNIVAQRLALPAEERFDLIVATNIFVYYDELQKALAMVNVEKMLQPGGVLLSNNALMELPSSRLRRIGSNTVQYSERQDNGDTVVWYKLMESGK